MGAEERARNVVDWQLAAERRAREGDSFAQFGLKILYIGLNRNRPLREAMIDELERQIGELEERLRSKDR